MTDTNPHNRLDAVIHVLDQYGRWFSQSLTRIFYPDSTAPKGTTHHIDAFNAWLSDQVEGGNIDAIIAADEECTKAMHDLQRTQGKPSVEAFKSFTQAYDNFIGVMRKYERNAALAKADIDPITGLRTQDLAVREFKRELDRVIRDGKLFSAALVRINFKNEQTRDDNAHDFIAVTDLIKQSIRSFDDAYILDNGEIFLLLKQADSTGGVRALKRLKGLLDNDLSGVRDTVNVLSCVATPGDGDNFETLIDNMHARLNEEPKDQARILEYIELSPLQKMLRT